MLVTLVPVPMPSALLNSTRNSASFLHQTSGPATHLVRRCSDKTRRVDVGGPIEAGSPCPPVLRPLRVQQEGHCSECSLGCPRAGVCKYSGVIVLFAEGKQHVSSSLCIATLRRVRRQKPDFTRISHQISRKKIRGPGEELLRPSVWCERRRYLVSLPPRCELPTHLSQADGADLDEALVIRRRSRVRCERIAPLVYIRHLPHPFERRRAFRRQWRTVLDLVQDFARAFFR